VAVGTWELLLTPEFTEYTLRRSVALEPRG